MARLFIWGVITIISGIILISNPAAYAVDHPSRPVLTLEAAQIIAAGVKLVPQKAGTAALFRWENGSLEDAINSKRPAVITAWNFVLMRGDLPISVNRKIVGAIGIAADTPDHDEQIAKAGIAAMSP